MYKKFKQVLFLMLCSLCHFASIATASTHPKDSVIDSITNTKFYKKIAINLILSQKNGSVIASKIAIHSVVLKPNSEKNIFSQTDTDMIPTVGNLLWTITTQQLPVSEEQCDKKSIELCKDMYSAENCYSPCLTYDPEPIIFDEKANKLYLAVGTTAVGVTGVGPHFTFIADINKKEIKPLTLETVDRPVDSTLSPSGNFLILHGMSVMNIINTKTGEMESIGGENNWRSGQERLHYMGNIKWLSDTRFSYQDGIRHSKFQESFDDMQESVYDIPTKKILQSRILAKTEYDSRAYKET